MPKKETANGRNGFLQILWFLATIPVLLCTSLRKSATPKLSIFQSQSKINKNLGACAMTTKFLDHRICAFKILLSWHFPTKKRNSVLDDFPLCPHSIPPPLKTAIFIFIVVSPPLKICKSLQNCSIPPLSLSPTSGIIVRGGYREGGYPGYRVPSGTAPKHSTSTDKNPNCLDTYQKALFLFGEGVARYIYIYLCRKTLRKHRCA